MSPRHVLSAEYEAKSSAYFGSARADMLRLVPKDVTNLLDVGCGSGDFGRLFKSDRVNATCTGIELTDWSSVAAAHLDRVLQLDVERDDLSELGMFECITFNDVLEHLSDPWRVVRRLSDHLLPGGWIVASSPNLRYYEVVKALLLRRRFDYAESGVMDRTHLRFFTESTFGELFDGAGLDVVSLGTHGGDGRLPMKLAMLNVLLFGSISDMRDPQLYCVARARK